MQLYLAHSFMQRHAVREWELLFESRTGIKLVNPFYDLNRDDIRRIDAGEQNRHEENHVLLVERDLTAIFKADGLLSVIDDKNPGSIGTPMEIVHAHMNNQFLSGSFIAPLFHDPKPIFCIAGTMVNHPWLVYHCSHIFATYDEFETYIKDNSNVQK